MTTRNRETTERVFIVDDDEAICTALCDLLESAGLSTQTFGSAEQFLAAWRPQMAGCLLLDVRLPGMSGMELQGRMLEQGLALPLIIMTAHGDMPMVKKTLKAGAVEFLIKPFSDGELLAAVEEAFARDRERREVGDLVQRVQARFATLTEREREVMELVTSGLTNKEIAEKLFLSVVTIKLHRGQVMRKMGAASLADLVKMAERAAPSRGPTSPQ